MNKPTIKSNGVLTAFLSFTIFSIGFAQTAPANATFGMTSGATGNLSGALYGPNVNEAGGIWSVNQGSGATGKTAFGFFGATKQ